MATRTLPENIDIIRNTGVYGPEMREAIAEAIEQADTYSDEKINTIRQEVNNKDLRMETTKISGTESDYLLTIVHPE